MTTPLWFISLEISFLEQFRHSHPIHQLARCRQPLGFLFNSLQRKRSPEPAGYRALQRCITARIFLKTLGIPAACQQVKLLKLPFSFGFISSLVDIFTGTLKNPHKYFCPDSERFFPSWWIQSPSARLQKKQKQKTNQNHTLQWLGHALDLQSSQTYDNPPV